MKCRDCRLPMVDVIELGVVTGSVCLSCGGCVTYLRGHEYAPTPRITLHSLERQAVEAVSGCVHSAETKALIGAKVRASHARRGHKCMEASA